MSFALESCADEAMIATLAPLLLSLSFQRGDPLPMMNRTQFRTQRSRWTEVPLGVAPRFGVDERLLRFDGSLSAALDVRALYEEVFGLHRRGLLGVRDADGRGVLDYDPDIVDDDRCITSPRKNECVGCGNVQHLTRFYVVVRARRLATARESSMPHAVDATPHAAVSV